MGKTIKKFSNVLSGILSCNGLSENQLEEIEHIMRIFGHGGCLVKLLLIPSGKTHSGGSLENCHLV
jgi:hypothetical protein